MRARKFVEYSTCVHNALVSLDNQVAGLDHETRVCAVPLQDHTFVNGVYTKVRFLVVGNFDAKLVYECAFVSALLSAIAPLVARWLVARLPKVYGELETARDISKLVDSCPLARITPKGRTSPRPSRTFGFVNFRSRWQNGSAAMILAPRVHHVTEASLCNGDGLPLLEGLIQGIVLILASREKYG
jgi:hypothetical protein